MEFTIKTGEIAQQKTPCILMGIFEGRKLMGSGQAIDQACGGRLSDLLSKGDMDGRIGGTLMLYDLPNLAAERILLVGCGKQEEFGRENYRKAIAAGITALHQTRAGAALCTLPELARDGLGLYTAVRDLILTSEDKTYRYGRTKTQDQQAPTTPLHTLSVWLAEPADQAHAQTAIEQGRAMAAGVKLAKELSNLPGNLCTPTYLADQALALGEASAALETEILDEADMAALGMGALLSVSRGSRQPAKLIVMHHRGGAAGEKPVVLVGKGLTFDSGGISIKPAADMDEMKYDMCGGAAVFGALQAASALALPLNLIGVVPASENMPDGDANKPGDIVTSMSGQTIEILNTDAEGRLILCDALTYCERFEPALVIDLATLTGACVIALGKHASGLFTQDDALAEEIIDSGLAAGDRAWRMPLWDDYQQQLDTNFADMANVGGREAGAVTAACFLARFTKAYRWAHLDIAGTTWLTGKEKGATGRPVALLTQLLLQRSGVIPH
ncbi:leucyl aminopeptidase [Thiocapsa imhoffii]|uniref:Probable cytosol aminopeptidase n=1 Tax=Thiocapsa imhoffii TaxID=382777 RepID=A0A9X0WEQ1_9GAMM|nr:leucyl aminopeptidase [Thiocapsa imhoffii]MBK1643287.1 leucyl aminopeptidase [Thiocapsa imhoffii]